MGRDVDQLDTKIKKNEWMNEWMNERKNIVVSETKDQKSLMKI